MLLVFVLFCLCNCFSYCRCNLFCVGVCVVLGLCGCFSLCWCSCLVGVCVWCCVCSVRVVYVGSL